METMMREQPTPEIAEPWDYEKASMMAAVLQSNPAFEEAFSLQQDGDEHILHKYERRLEQIGEQHSIGVDDGTLLSELARRRAEKKHQLDQLEAQIVYETGRRDNLLIRNAAVDRMISTASELYDTNPENFKDWEVDDFLVLNHVVDSTRRRIQKYDMGINNISDMLTKIDIWTDENYYVTQSTIDLVRSEIESSFVFLVGNEQTLTDVRNAITVQFTALKCQLPRLSPSAMRNKLRELVVSWLESAEDIRNNETEMLEDILSGEDGQDRPSES